LLKTEHPRGVDVPVTIETEAAGEHAKAQEPSDMGNVVLERGPTVLMTKAFEEDLEVTCRQCLQSSGIRIELEMVE
jgi:hypothetical protein